MQKGSKRLIDGGLNWNIWFRGGKKLGLKGRKGSGEKIISRRGGRSPRKTGRNFRRTIRVLKKGVGGLGPTKMVKGRGCALPGNQNGWGGGSGGVPHWKGGRAGPCWGNGKLFL